MDEIKTNDEYVKNQYNAFKSWARGGAKAGGEMPQMAQETIVMPQKVQSAPMPRGRLMKYTLVDPEVSSEEEEAPEPIQQKKIVSEDIDDSDDDELGLDFDDLGDLGDFTNFTPPNFRGANSYHAPPQPKNNVEHIKYSTLLAPRHRR